MQRYFFKPDKPRKAWNILYWFNTTPWKWGFVWTIFFYWRRFQKL